MIFKISWFLVSIHFWITGDFLNSFFVGIGFKIGGGRKDTKKINYSLFDQNRVILSWEKRTELNLTTAQ